MLRRIVLADGGRIRLPYYLTFPGGRQIEISGGADTLAVEIDDARGAASETEMAAEAEEIEP